MGLRLGFFDNIEIFKLWWIVVEWFVVFGVFVCGLEVIGFGLVDEIVVGCLGGMGGIECGVGLGVMVVF